MDRVARERRAAIVGDVIAPMHQFDIEREDAAALCDMVAESGVIGVPMTYVGVSHGRISSISVVSVSIATASWKTWPSAGPQGWKSEEMFPSVMFMIYGRRFGDLRT